MTALAPVLDLRPDAKDGLRNLDTELALLGAILSDAGPVLDTVSDAVRPDDFAEEFHGRLFGVCLERWRDGLTIDALTVGEALKTDPAFVDIGGLQFLLDLVDKAPASIHAPDYATIIADLSQRRGLVRLAAEAGARATNDTQRSATEIVTETEQRLGELASHGPVRNAWKSGGRVIKDAIANAQERAGRIDFGTGLQDVDRLLGGFSAGEMAVIGGRPGMGKSVVGVAIAKANAAQGRGTLVFSQEMAADQLGLRLACDLAYERPDVRYSMLAGDSRNPTFDAARKGELSGEQWDRLKEAGERVRGWPLQFDCRPGLTPSHMEACARRAFRHWERKGIAPGPIVIDHLGISKPEGQRGGNKVQEIGDISRGFAEMAKRLDVPVIALCQLSRQNEQREGKRPELSDLRWSGELEQDARQVIFLYRPEYYLFAPAGDESMEDRVERETKLSKARHRLHWIIAKNNSGPIGSVETFCDIGCSAVRDRTEGQP